MLRPGSLTLAQAQNPYPAVQARPIGRFCYAKTHQLRDPLAVLLERQRRSQTLHTDKEKPRMLSGAGPWLGDLTVR